MQRFLSQWSRVVLLLSLLAPLACQEKPRQRLCPSNVTTPPYPLPSGGTHVVARVGDVSITREALEKRARSKGDAARARLEDPAARLRLVEEEVERELLIHEGWARRLYEDPEIRDQYRRLIEQRVRRDLLQRAQTVEVSEEDLREAYEQRKEALTTPARARLEIIVRRIRTNDARRDERVRLVGAAEEIERREKGRDARAFTDVASRLSEDEGTRSQGGQLPLLTERQLAGRFGERLAHSALTMPKRQLTIIDTPDAVVLVRKIDEQSPHLEPFENLRFELRSQLLSERRQQSLDKELDVLKTTYGVTIDPAAVDALGSRSHGAEALPATRPASPSEPSN